MTEKRRRPAARDAGFTLIELLVVIIVIGILATIAIPTYLRQKEKAYRAQALADMKNAGIAVETFATEHVSNSYAAMDGADKNDPSLQAEGFRPSQWVTLRVFATDNTFCIEGENKFVPGKTFVFRSTSGRIEIAATGMVTCA